MPWGTNTVSELRTAFVHAVRTAKRPVAAAARDFKISRKTAYKWLALFDAQQPLTDASRRPKSSPARTSEALESAVLAVRDQHGWGPRKIVAYLVNQNQPTVPARTAAAILQRHKRIAIGPAPEVADQRFERARPNELWQVDFKGYVEVARRKVYPLTVLDDHSRFLLALECGDNVTMAQAWKVLWNVFGEYGLPEAILCDNAFGSSGPGVSWFEGRLMRLGIRACHGRPYHPQTQGKVERLHGTLEREVFPRLDRSDRVAFEGGLDRWRREVYNVIRPHESLGDQPPACRWRPSTRPRPKALPAMEYEVGAVLRRVSTVGDVRWRGCKVLAGNGLVGERVRVEETDDAVALYYGPHRIREIPVANFQKGGLL
jgi:transposase InsO family protein